MILPNLVFEMKWTRRNYKWYISKGYNFTKYGDTFLVNAEDLSKGCKKKVLVLCDYCGIIKSIVYKDYAAHERMNYACCRCRATQENENNLYLRLQSLYDRALDFCYEKGYNLLTKKEDIMGASTIVEYECKIHGIHRTKVYLLVTGHGCPQCKYNECRIKARNSAEKLLDDFSYYGTQVLNVEDYTKSTDKNLYVICNGCGETFLTSYYSFMKHHGLRCPTCSHSESNGEFKIRSYLESHNINFVLEKIFDDCRDINPLPFDFYLPDYNMCIEFLGKQHYKIVNIFGGADRLEYQMKHDNIKRCFCMENGINLLEIRYTDFDEIDKILNEQINT